MNFIRSIQIFCGKLRLRHAIKMADKAHARTGHRYYVLPQDGPGKKLIVMDRSNFRKLKFKHYINHDTYVADIDRECFYATSYSDGSRRLSPVEIQVKRALFLSWLLDLHPC